MNEIIDCRKGFLQQMMKTLAQGSPEAQEQIVLLTMQIRAFDILTGLGEEREQYILDILALKGMIQEEIRKNINLYDGLLNLLADKKQLDQNTADKLYGLLKFLFQYHKESIAQDHRDSIRFSRKVSSAVKHSLEKQRDTADPETSNLCELEDLQKLLGIVATYCSNQFKQIKTLFSSNDGNETVNAIIDELTHMRDLVFDCLTQLDEEIPFDIRINLIGKKNRQTQKPDQVIKKMIQQRPQKVMNLILPN